MQPRLARAAVAIAMMVAGSLAADEALFQAELLFEPEGWHNHASCIVEAPDGSLLVCWYHGSGERKADDVEIQGARKRPGETAWSPRFLMADTPGYPDCNPAMFVDPKNRLWLFWPTILDHRWESALLKYRIASDWFSSNEPPQWDWQEVLHVTPKDLSSRLLETFNMVPEAIKNVPRLSTYFETARTRASEELYLRLGWMPRAHPIRLASGKWILPLYCDTFSISIMAISADEGKTWQASAPLIGFGNIQPSVVEKRDGTLVAYMRDNGVQRRIRVSQSRDEGLTWSPVGALDLSNPGSGLEVLRLQNGHWILIHNDTVRGRHSLAVSISEDEGVSWKWTRHLERVEAEKGNFSYPSIIQTRDGLLHATYSYSAGAGSSIKHAVFNEAWVQKGD